MFYLTNTDNELLRYISEFGGLSLPQIEEILPGRTSEAINKSLTSLVRKGLVRLIGEEKEYAIEADFTNDNQSIDMNMMDAVWVMLSHLETQEELSMAMRPQPPALLTYLKDDCIYYIYAMKNENDSATIRMLDEQLKAKGTDDVKMFIIVHSREEVLRIPENLSVRIMIIHLVYPNGNRALRPEVNYSG